MLMPALGLPDTRPRALYMVTQQSLRLNNGKPDYKTAQALADQAA
jgi:3-oxocholest-4-en-26-oate---CoA ligase